MYREIFDWLREREADRKVLYERAKKLRDEAGALELASEAHYAETVREIERRLRGKGIALRKASDHMMILALEGDQLYIAEADAAGFVTEHIYGPADIRDERVCQTCPRGHEPIRYPAIKAV